LITETNSLSDLLDCPGCGKDVFEDWTDYTDIFDCDDEEIL
jgi:hypothetical protein